MNKPMGAIVSAGLGVRVTPRRPCIISGTRV